VFYDKKYTLSIMSFLLTTINSKYIHQNLAIRILYELNKHHKSLHVTEFGLKNTTDEIAGFCSNYSVVAFSCYIWNISKTLQAAQKIKQINPNCLILLGGPEVSYEWEPIINLPYIDCIIKDEGEIPFTTFLSQFPEMKNIPGLVWKHHGILIDNGTAPLAPIQQWQKFNPYRSIPNDELLHKISYFETSRGCPHCCEFCLAGLQNNLRYFPMPVIHQNLTFLMERARVIKFLDRTFNANPKFAIEVFQFILDNHKPGNVFQFEIKADILQVELIEFINTKVPAGLFRFEIGIQTLNAKSNHEVKRRQNFENIKTFIKSISHKVEIHLDLIVGLPHDYLDDIKNSFEEVFKLFAPELQLGFLKFLKGTPIRQNAALHGYQFDPLPPYQIKESNYLSARELEEVTLVEHVLDIYWNKKRAINTLHCVAMIYPVYDFFKELGRYWHETKNQQNRELIAVYNTLFQFSVQFYPNDPLLPELIALDYYLQHKIRPAIRFLPETEKAIQNSMIAQLKLNHHKYRYVIHRVHFSVQKMVIDKIMEPKTDWLILEYSGVERPRVIIYE
jgi:anaerobic magnesium-protoporphyrin IX monomethyl ester cyclase